MPRAIKDVNELPSWFNLRNYAGARDLTTYGWYWQFLTRARDYDPSSAVDQVYEGIIPVPKGQQIGLTLRLDPSEVGTPVVFSAGRGRSLDRYLSRGLVMADFERVLVYLHAPDDLIVRAFKEWLVTRRKRGGPSSRRRKIFTQTDFASWHRHKVVPYLDLKRWAYLEERRITYLIYGKALFPQYSESDKAEWVRKTTVPKAKEMLKIWILELLALQAKAEKNHS